MSALNFLFADEPVSKPVNKPDTQAITWEASDSLSISHAQSIVNQALSVTEIAVHIRGELQGVHLKSMVLVNRFWWKIFGPYLWENIFIDADPQQGDRQIIFRNGLAARCLTLSLYDHLDRNGVASYVTEKCRNITHLRLKLFSPNLVAFSDHTQQQQSTLTVQKEEHEFNLIDNMISKLPYISELTFYMADENVRPEILWCVTKLPHLRNLKIVGGLSAGKYMIHKNWNCNWPLLLRIARECPTLQSLDVAWRSGKPKDFSQVSTQTTAEEHSAKETGDFPRTEQISSLKYLSISDSQFEGDTLDNIFRSCPNLRKVSLGSIDITKDNIVRSISVLTSSCQQLKSLEIGYMSRSGGYLSTLLEGALLSIPTLTLEVGSLQCSYFEESRLKLPMQLQFISTLNLKGVSSPDLLFIIMSDIISLQHLTLEGRIGRAGSVQVLYDSDQSSVLRLPNFASNSTLQFIDVSRLIFASLKLHKLFFDRVQNIAGLKHLEINNRQLQDARIEETWIDPDADPNIDLSRKSLYPEKAIHPSDIRKRRINNFLRYRVAYANTKDKEWGPEDEAIHVYYWNQYPSMPDESTPDELAAFTAAVDSIPEKVFVLFPGVEYLYIHDDSPVRDFKNMEHYISEHIASAIVRMMPKLKVMAYDRALGEGLSRVKKLYRHIIYDQTKSK